MPDTNPPRFDAGTETKPQARPEARDTARGRPPKRRGWATRLIGLAALLVALLLAGYGILNRNETRDQQADWTHRQAVPTVSVRHPAPETAARAITLPGDIEAWYQAPIYARVNGYVKMWYKDIGDHVKAGDVLAVIDTPELDQQLSQSRADLLTAQTNEKLAQVTAKRWQALVSSNSVSVQSTDEKVADANAKAALTKAAQANVDRIQAMLDFQRLVAPFAGVVTVRRTDIGALISAGSGTSDRELFAVADIHRMRIYVRVPQVYAATIANGMPATLKLPQYPDRAFTAVVATSANAIDPQSRTVLVQLWADNAKGELWPGTYAQVTFQLPPNPEALMIPAGSLIFQEHGAEVAVLDAQDRVQMKPVTIGKDEGTHLEVLSGLTASDRVIDSPPDTLTSGETVHVMPEHGRPAEDQAGQKPPESAQK